MNVDEPEAVPIEELERQGWALVSERQYDAAVARFKTVFARDPKSVAAYQGTIAALRKQQRYKEAETLLAKASAVHPEAAGILAERAWLHVEQNQKAEAIGAFEAAIERMPNDEGLYLWRIYLLRELGKFDACRDAIRAARGVFPSSARLQSEEGWLHFAQHEYHAALEAFSDVLKHHPADESALQGRIASLRLLGRYEEARRVADDALRTTQGNRAIRNELGWLLFALGQYEAAEDAFRFAMGLDPHDAAGYVNLAWALIRQNTETARTEAAALCREALRLDSRFAAAFGCLGVIAFQRGAFRESEVSFERSIAVDPDRGHYADLAALQIAMGRHEEAEKTLQTAIAKNASDPYAHIQRGNLCLETGRLADATREYRLAAALDPFSSDGTRALAIALTKNDQLPEAERTLREALRRRESGGENQAAELHVALAEVLMRQADQTGDTALLEEALREANVAIKIRPRYVAGHFQAGLVRYKLDDLRGALGSFRKCQNDATYGLQADLNVKRLSAAIRRANVRAGGPRVISALLAVVIIAQLSLVWMLRFRPAAILGTKPDSTATTSAAAATGIPDATFAVLIPVLIAFLLVVALLPNLKSLKVTGLEADLSQPGPEHTLPAGPKGEVGAAVAGPR